MKTDEQKIQPVDHSLWQDVLTAYLYEQPDGQLRLFRYNNVLKSDRQKLQRYLALMETLDPWRYPKDEQKAYWINLYNALTINLVIQHYPVKSIKSIGPWYRFGPWDEIIVRVVGKPLTLNDIEHQILRRHWSDKRIHYALNCASRGCPDLAAQVFTAENTDQLLDQLARRFVRQNKGVRFEGKQLILSKIYRWYKSDFGDNASLLTHLRQYSTLELARSLHHFSGTIIYQYDWSLNIYH